MFTYTTPFEPRQCSREGPAQVFSGANILFPPASSTDIFEWIQLQKELERREAAKQRELRKPRVVKKIESEDAYQLQIFKEFGDFNSYEVEAKKKPGNRVHLTISSKDDQFSKTFEFSLNEIEVSKVDWEWYKKENVLVLNIPKKQQVEYTFYSHPLFGLIQQQPEGEQVQNEQERREIAHKKALEYRKRAEHAREKAQRKKAEEERKRLEAQEKKRIEEKRRAEAEERKRLEAQEKKRIEERRRAEAEERRRIEAVRRAELEAAKKAKEEAQRRARIEAEQRRREQQEQAAAFAAIRELQRQAYVQLQKESERKAEIERQEAERKEEERQAKIERERFDYREAQRQAHRRQQQEAEKKTEQEARKASPQVQNVQLDPSNPEVFLQQLFGSILAASQGANSAESSQAPVKQSSTESPVSSSAATPEYDDSDNESINSDHDPETPEPSSPRVPPSSPGLKLAKQPSLEEVEDEEFVMFRKKFGQK